jgi:hypothetical protein
MSHEKNEKKVRVLPSFITEHKANKRPFEVRQIKENVEIFQNGTLIGYGYIKQVKDNGKTLIVWLKSTVIVAPHHARLMADETQLVWVPYWQRYKVLELPQKSALGHCYQLKRDKYFMPLDSITVKFYPSNSKVPKPAHLPAFRKLWKERCDLGNFYGK